MYIRMTVIMALCMFFAGCGGIFNPYKSEFDCPMRDKGECVSVPEAYSEAVSRMPRDANNKSSRYSTRKPDASSSTADPEQINPRDIYQQEMAKKLTSYIRQPNTPFISPPTVMRTLILPYKASSKDLYSERYIYIVVDEPQWVMSAPTYGAESKDMILEKTEIPVKK
jgi:conjugal transfer pilus assembly protein TraV